jgi:alpha-1,3-glucosyltransferase
MLIVSNLNYASTETIYYQRLSVIVADIILFFAILQYVGKQSISMTLVCLRTYCFVRFTKGLQSLNRIKDTKTGVINALVVLCITFLNAGLFIVDRSFLFALFHYQPRLRLQPI